MDMTAPFSIAKHSIRVALFLVIALLSLGDLSIERRNAHAQKTPDNVDLTPLARLLGENEAAKPSDIKIYESGFINASRYMYMFWIDNERVMFQGFDRKKGVPGSVQDGLMSTSKSTWPVYIWSYKTGETRLYATETKGLCYRSGKVNYLHDPVKEKPYVVVGPLGKEKKEPRPPFATGNEVAGFEFLRCERSNPIYEDFARRTGLTHRRLLVLLAEHGVIDRGPNRSAVSELGDPNFHVKLYRPNSKTGIDLYRIEGERKIPVRYSTFENDVFGRSSYYYEFADVYLFYSPATEETPHSVGNWPKGMPYPVHLFKPSGETKTVKVPYGPWADVGGFALTRKGIYVISQRIRAPWVPDTSGGFLLAPDGKVTHLIKGHTNSLEVSPDGCKVAVGIRPNEKDIPLSAYEVKVVQLCEGK